MVTEKEQQATEEVKTAEDELDGLMQERENLIREITSRDNAISKLEQALAGKESELTAQKQTLSEAENRINQLSEALNEAVTGYRDRVIEANQGVLAELVSGDTIEAINESLKNARALMERVRQEMEAEAARTRIPAGAPQRTPPDLSALSPREKIQYAIGGER